MVKKSFLIILSIFLLSLFVLSFPSIPEAQAKKFHLKMGSTSVRSGLYANTVAIAGLVNKAYPGEITVTVVETGGYIENLARFKKGTIQAGPVSTGAAAACYQGILDWEGKPDKNLRALWGGYFGPIHFVASKKSGITSLEGLAGRPFAFNPGTTSGWHIDYFLKALAIKPEYKLMGLGASPDAMKAGVVESWYKAGYKDAAILDIEATMEITIIPIRPDHLEKAEKVQPGLHLGMTIPAGLFKAVKADQLSYAYVLSDFIHKDVPDEVVYKIVKVVWDNRASLVASFASFKEGNFDDMVGNAIKYNLKVPFHAGAVKFYREVGQTIPPALIPPEMKR